IKEFKGMNPDDNDSFQIIPKKGLPSYNFHHEKLGIFFRNKNHLVDIDNIDDEFKFLFVADANLVQLIQQVLDIHKTIFNKMNIVKEIVEHKTKINQEIIDTLLERDAITPFLAHKLSLAFHAPKSSPEDLCNTLKKHIKF